MSETSYRLAIDVGGTFTDIVLLDEHGTRVWFAKVLSTPEDPAVGSLDGARALLERTGIGAGAVRDVVHATTVATNAVLEGKGARTGLITTAGFRDALEMGREARYDIYDLGIEMPPPLVPRRWRLELTERVGFDGEVLTPFDEDEAARVVRALVEEGEVRSLAICLLHGYAHPAHEARLAALARRLFPALSVSVSHEVAAEIREFERVSTTVVDAYVKPLVRAYVGRLDRGLKAMGLQRSLSMMLSHGGIGAAAEVAESFPVRMIESGPAAGAIAAGHFARLALPTPDAIAFDMGGTTAKISLIRGGEPATTNEFEVAHVRRFKRGSGYPLQIAAVELLEIGAGGGSIAHVNALGLLNVGPASAGADPGPICYAQGGREPTVTDADLLLGYLDPAHFLGGTMRLDASSVRAAIASGIAARLKLDVTAVAWGIHDVVNESMAAAMRTHAAEKGIDFRNFAMIAFGGAGPVHAYALARKLGLRRVVCPFGAGVASAIGCLAATPAVESVTPHAGLLEALDWDEVAGHFASMRRWGETSLAALIGEEGEIAMRRAVDMRCQGQGYSVTVQVAHAGDPICVAALRRGFAERYQAMFGHAPPAVALETVALRARVFSPRPDLTLAMPAHDAGAALKGHRAAYFDAAGGYAQTAVYDRHRLQRGEVYRGPAIIEERETSIVTGPDTHFHVDDTGNVVIDLED